MKCLQCGIELTGRDQKKFCGHSCAAKYNNKASPKRKRAITICPICGSETKGTQYKFCSRECLNNHRKNSSSKILSKEELRAREPIEGISLIIKNTKKDENGCWVWQKTIENTGYGSLSEKGKTWSAHVYAYSCENGIPCKGKVIRHLCHNRRCCNPEHLRIGSYKDNYYDSFNKHMAARRRTRMHTIVNGISYEFARQAARKLHIGCSTLTKYRSEDGVVDVISYNIGCIIGNRVPAVEIENFIKTEYKNVFKNYFNGTFYYWNLSTTPPLAKGGFLSPHEANKDMLDKIKK